MNTNQKKQRLAALRQNMANKMLAGIDYSYEEAEIVKLNEELKASNG